MLLEIFIAEEKFVNGSVGKVIEMMYANHDLPNLGRTLPSYVVVNFPEFSFPLTCVQLTFTLQQTFLSQ